MGVQQKLKRKIKPKKEYFLYRKETHLKVKCYNKWQSDIKYV